MAWKHEFNHYGKRFPSVNSFAEAERLYKNTTPLQGKRSHLDIRPIGNDRYYLYSSCRIIKVDDNRYTLTLWYESSGWARSRSSVEENLGVTWSRDDSFSIQTGYLGNSWSNFISQVLPSNMFLTRYDTKTYLAIGRSTGTEYYLLRDPKDVPLQLKKVKGEWHVQNPVQEYRRRATSKIKKVIEDSADLREFEQYARTIWDMLTYDVATANGANYSCHWIHNPYAVKETLSDKSNWLKACCELKGVRWDTPTQRPQVREMYICKTFDTKLLYKSMYKVHKDKFNTDPVPIGTRCRRHWLDK